MRSFLNLLKDSGIEWMLDDNGSEYYDAELEDLEKFRKLILQDVAESLEEIVRMNAKEDVATAIKMYSEALKKGL